MCDFSLDFVASRPARVGDKLLSTRFDNSFTRGFAAVGEPGVAVCLLPGTELAFQRPVECKRGWGVLPNMVIENTVARFRQINMDSRGHITMHWSSRMDKSCCSTALLKVNRRAFCNYQLKSTTCTLRTK